MSYDWAFDSELPAEPADTLPDEELEPIEPPRVGERFDDYELIGELGRGGTAVVYRARDRVGREVALKVLSLPHGPQVKRLEREGELVAALRHPGIVQVIRRGRVGSHHFLAYELVESRRDLDEELRLRDRAGRLNLVEQIAEAVGYAHQQGVVHRDLKPDNVLVDEQGQARVTDFGLATTAGLERLTRTGAMVGTPLYMAPEQVQGDREAQGPQTDVWALGVILYQALTGERPFNGGNLQELASAICLAKPFPPRRHDPSIPTALEELCLASLSRSPDQRPVEGWAFLRELRAARLQPEPPRRGLWLSALGAVALAAAFGLGAGLVQRELQTAPTPTPTPAPAFDPSAELARAESLVDAKRYREAELLLNRLVVRIPESPATWRLLGDLNAEQLRYDPAQRCYSRSLELEEDAITLVDRALSRLHLGERQGAQADVQRAFELAPQEARVHEAQAACHYFSGDARAMLEAAEQALALDDTRANAHNLQGLALLELGQAKRALACFDRSLALEETAAVLANRGLAFLALGKLQRAREALEASLALDSRDPQPWTMLGVVHAKQRRFPEAQAALQRALEIDGDHGPAHYQLATVHKAEGRPERAAAAVERALELLERGHPLAVEAERLQELLRKEKRKREKERLERTKGEEKP